MGLPFLSLVASPPLSSLNTQPGSPPETQPVDSREERHWPVPTLAWAPARRAALDPFTPRTKGQDEFRSPSPPAGRL